MLTAKDGDLDEAEALDTGADDYLTKPFSFPVLVARVRALLRRRGGRATRVPATVGSLRDRLASAGGCGRATPRSTLTRREFDVLEFLVRRAGQVVSKDEILAGVWEFDFDGDPNIVEVYVGRLRRKIDEPFGTHHITTVRGAGYRLDGDAAEPSRRRLRTVRCPRHRVAAVAVGGRARRRPACCSCTCSAPGSIEQLDESLRRRGRPDRRGVQGRQERRRSSIDDDDVVVLLGADGEVVDGVGAELDGAPPIGARARRRARRRRRRASVYDDETVSPGRRAATTADGTTTASSTSPRRSTTSTRASPSCASRSLASIVPLAVASARRDRLGRRRPDAAPGRARSAPRSRRSALAELDRRVPAPDTATTRSPASPRR